jgi:hypothetical protein
VQVLSGYDTGVTRKLAPGLGAEGAWDDFEALLVWKPLPIDAALLGRAREIGRRYRLRWRDT